MAWYKFEDKAVFLFLYLLFVKCYSKPLTSFIKRVKYKKKMVEGEVKELNRSKREWRRYRRKIRRKKWFCHGCICCDLKNRKGTNRERNKIFSSKYICCYPFTNSPQKSYYFCCYFCILHQTDNKLFRRFLQKQFSDRECLDIGDSGVLALWRAEADSLDRYCAPE